MGEEISEGEIVRWAFDIGSGCRSTIPRGLLAPSSSVNLGREPLDRSGVSLYAWFTHMNRLQIDQSHILKRVIQASHILKCSSRIDSVRVVHLLSR